MQRTGITLATRRVRGNGYSLFLQLTRGHEQLQGLSIGKRGKKLAEMWRCLGEDRRQALHNKVKRFGLWTDKAKPASPGWKRGSALTKAYRQFCKKNLRKKEGNSRNNMKAVAKLWQKSKNKKE